MERRPGGGARTASQLGWRAAGRQLYLIEDSELRSSYGPLMGQIAHSHWWSTAELPRVFKRSLGPPPWCPAEWIVNPLRLACLLRVCDAVHLDSRRAPQFLRALREPLPPPSADHWTFQERLRRPHLSGAYLEFTAGDHFGPEDADAWWLCHDTLRRADQWIREVQAVLADTGMEGLAIQGIAGVEDSRRLAQLIPTRGWIPIDTDIERAASAWGQTKEEVHEAMMLSWPRDQVTAQIGSRNGEPVTLHYVDALVRPDSGRSR